MPWHIEDDNSDCSGYAVVQNDNDKVMGCHDTLGEAEDQMAALYANEKERPVQHKSYSLAEFKAIDGPSSKSGTFEAIVSVYGNVDHIGDKVMDTAFDGSIKRWNDSGDHIPVIWSHEWGNPFAHVGFVTHAESIPGKGLKIRGEIPFEDETGADLPFSRQVYSLMKRRLVKEFSFGYEIIDERQGKDRSNELHELDIIEVGPTLKGMNPSTELLGVKAELEQASEIGELKQRVAALEAQAADKYAVLEMDEQNVRQKAEQALTRALDEAFGQVAVTTSEGQTLPLSATLEPTPGATFEKAPEDQLLEDALRALDI